MLMEVLGLRPGINWLTVEQWELKQLLLEENHCNFSSERSLGEVILLSMLSMWEITTPFKQRMCSLQWVPSQRLSHSKGWYMTNCYVHFTQRNKVGAGPKYEKSTQSILNSQLRQFLGAMPIDGLSWWINQRSSYLACSAWSYWWMRWSMYVP